MFKNFLFIFLVLSHKFCAFLTDHVPLPFNGKCPRFDHCTDKGLIYDPKQIVGYNYLISSVPYFFQVEEKCTWYNFTEYSNSSLLMQKYETNILTNKLRQTNGILEYKSDGNTFVKYTDLEIPFNFKTVRVTPDYHVVVGCNDCGFLSKTGAGVYAYGFSKVPWPSCKIIQAITEKFEECGIQKKYIKIENQDGCGQCRKL
ncbi:hypothetical protein PVAND_013077 [Polypedilum vanderplanki]|uniref:Uncharacterized protein n=1 Tax=Polypedilum vanderplanki TaxID=319348 RepID=A0A9J6CPA3_POLVA|nr:hypothetical protein PVAND_013077 [Polypedilum vanderplanki]